MRPCAKEGKYCKLTRNLLILFAFWGMRFARPGQTLEESLLMPMTAKKKKAKKAPKKKAKKAKRKKK